MTFSDKLPFKQNSQLLTILGRHDCEPTTPQKWEKKWIVQLSEAEGDKAKKRCENGEIILGFHRGKIFHSGKTRRENSNFIFHLGYNATIKTFNNEKHFTTIAKRETNITE